MKISSRIRSMSGRFSVPSDIDYNSLKTDVLEENMNFLTSKILILNKIQNNKLRL